MTEPTYILITQKEVCGRVIKLVKEVRKGDQISTGYEVKTDIQTEHYFAFTRSAEYDATENEARILFDYFNESFVRKLIDLETLGRVQKELNIQVRDQIFAFEKEQRTKKRELEREQMLKKKDKWWHI